jgi:hypothetical protein
VVLFLIRKRFASGKVGVRGVIVFFSDKFPQRYP